jgi:hypothetical protein
VLAGADERAVQAVGDLMGESELDLVEADNLEASRSCCRQGAGDAAALACSTLDRRSSATTSLT